MSVYFSLTSLSFAHGGKALAPHNESICDRFRAVLEGSLQGTNARKLEATKELWTYLETANRPAMEIVNFFEKLAGRWFSQRTTHALSTQQSKAGKSDLEVEFLAGEAEEVMAFWRAHPQFQVLTGSASAPLCGLRIQQSSTVEGENKPKVATMLMVPLTAKVQDKNLYTGALIRSGSLEKSTYTLEDDVLTIISDTPDARSEERLWFINDNLRMRTSNTELKSGPNSGLRVASFCSEIRLGVKPPKAD